MRHSRSSQADTDEIDGGRREVTDTHAPKVIRSREVTSFFCLFSTVTYVDAPEIPPAGVYHLEANIRGDGVSGRLRFRPRNASGTDTAFSADRGFLDVLAGVIERYGLARFNGTHVTVSGLPDMYGAELHVCYASGESISASDNQDCFLPPAALSELVRAFTGRAGITTFEQSKGV
ncbi:MAG: hypothetical protein IKU55_00195 [Clostridia bacterium]|nr:hypothetical protein [Clostridia bacterium]